MRIRWTKYVFTAPIRFSENDFLHARLYPGQFRRRRWRAILEPLVLTACRALGVVAIVWLGAMKSESLNHSPILAWFLVVLGLAAVVSLSSCTPSNICFIGSASSVSPAITRMWSRSTEIWGDAGCCIARSLPAGLASLPGNLPNVFG
jgi:hypothetical protein